jgi:hypothetical protein
MKWRRNRRQRPTSLFGDKIEYPPGAHGTAWTIRATEADHQTTASTEARLEAIREDVEAAIRERLGDQTND